MDRVVAGDYKGSRVVLTMRGKLLIRAIYGGDVPLDKEHVRHYEVTDEDQGFSVGRAAVGAALFGTAGAILGGSKTSYRVSLEFFNGKRSLVEISSNYYKILTEALF